MTPSEIQAKLKELEAERERVVGFLNQLTGWILALQWALTETTPAEPESRIRTNE